MQYGWLLNLASILCQQTFYESLVKIGSKLIELESGNESAKCKWKILKVRKSIQSHFFLDFQGP